MSPFPKLGMRPFNPQDTLYIIETFQPFPSLHISPNRSLMSSEVAAYESMHPALVKQYLGQYVAIYQGKLVDHDADEEALMQRRRRDYPGKVVLVRRVEQAANRFAYTPSAPFVEMSVSSALSTATVLLNAFIDSGADATMMPIAVL